MSITKGSAARSIFFPFENQRSFSIISASYHKLGIFKISKLLGNVRQLKDFFIVLAMSAHPNLETVGEYTSAHDAMALVFSFLGPVSRGFKVIWCDQID